MANNITVISTRFALNYTTDEEFFHRTCAGIIGLLMLFSLFTNAIAMQVFLSRRFNEHTVSKYLYANISFSDLVFLISCVFLLALEAIECNVVCHAMGGIILTASACVSSYTMALIAINRYYACASPMKHYVQKEDENYIRKWLVLIALVWLFSLTASPFFMRYAEIRQRNGTESSLLLRQCVKFTYILEAQMEYPYFYLIGVVTIPLMIGLFFSLMAIRTLRKTLSPDHRHLKRDRKEKLRSIFRIATVITAFAICWLPSSFLHLHETGNIELIKACDLNYNAHSLFAILLMADFLLNPIIYCYMNPDFRKAIKIILFGHVTKMKRSVTMDKPKIFSIFKKTETIELNPLPTVPYISQEHLYI